LYFWALSVLTAVWNGKENSYIKITPDNV
jgi:hypothetical protein